VVSNLHVGEIIDALERRLHPTVNTWNRLESRPRSESLVRALEAEVRDPLWMLTRQWQMGEFRGSDAGSPVFAKVQVDTTTLTKYRAGESVPELMTGSVPMEATVERRPLAFTVGGQAMALDLRLAIGREWLALIAGIGNYRAAYLAAYPILAPDPAVAADAQLCSDPRVWEMFAAVAGRAMDGGALYEYLVADDTHEPWDGVAGVLAADQPGLHSAALSLIAWFQRLILQPPVGGDDAWNPQQLEYQFGASAPLPGGREKVYIADEYADGQLDWYRLDVDGAAAALGAVSGSEVVNLPGPVLPAARTMIPVPVSFSGMPNTRWWTFEDQKTNYGDVDASTTDLAKLMFLEFALVYANDWFVIPYTLPVGAVAAVRGLAVTNTFGERLWVEAADAGLDADDKRWSMFTINVRGVDNAPADPSLLLLPTVAKIDEGAPIEDVMMVRDEVANMVWGIEQTVPLATGETGRGLEQARLLHAFLQAKVAAGPPALPPVAPIQYEVMTTVPENWIPFIPVHVDGSNREIQLQRAALPRILDGDTAVPVKIQPRGVLLRQGLDLAVPTTYLVNEEEVPRAGARVLQAFERTRWNDGRVFVWQRVRRQTGRGEGSSGLAFDVLANEPVGG
jgi:hypothetical protein